MIHTEDKLLHVWKELQKFLHHQPIKSHFLPTSDGLRKKDTATRRWWRTADSPYSENSSIGNTVNGWIYSGEITSNLYVISGRKSIPCNSGLISRRQTHQALQTTVSSHLKLWRDHINPSNHWVDPSSRHPRNDQREYFNYFITDTCWFSFLNDFSLMFW